MKVFDLNKEEISVGLRKTILLTMIIRGLLMFLGIKTQEEFLIKLKMHEHC
jgi:hypothetical protein